MSADGLVFAEGLPDDVLTTGNVAAVYRAGVVVVSDPGDGYAGGPAGVEGTCADTWRYRVNLILGSTKASRMSEINVPATVSIPSSSTMIPAR